MTHAYDAVRALLTENDTVFLPGVTAEVRSLNALLMQDAPRRANFVTALLPGVNEHAYALTPNAQLTTFMLPQKLRPLFQDGRVRLMPLSYSDIATYMQRSVFDVAVAHVAAPDRNGRASVGINADFTTLAWPRAKKRVALVNTAMPATSGASIDIGDADVVIEISEPLIEFAEAAPSATTIAMSKRAAELTPDGAVVQIGLGGAPAAAPASLVNHRKLCIRSGMISPSITPLMQSDALDMDRAHVIGVAAGDKAFYADIAAQGVFQFAPATVTHDSAALGALPRFTSINGALEVDVFGQINLEWRDGVCIGGIGGAADFMRAARRSEGGASIVTLASQSKDGRSRIVPRLASPAVSIARSDADIIVTEFGAAALRGLSVDERAAALIEIAAPAHRADLADQWARWRATS